MNEPEALPVGTDVEPLENEELSFHEWGKFAGVIKEEEEFLTPHLYY